MTDTALQVKEVNFNGDNLIAIQNEQGIYTAIKHVTKALDFSAGQTKRLMQNLTTDEVIQKGVANLRYPSRGGEQETVCILIDFLPLWLAKISITPAMKRDNPALVEKLIQYQLKAKDVLAEAFLPKQVINYNPNTYLSLINNLNDNQRILVSEMQRIDSRIDSIAESNQTGIMSMAYELEAVKNSLIPKTKAYDTFINSDGYLSLNKVAKSIGVGRNKMMDTLRDKKILFKDGKDSIPYQRFVDSGYFKVNHAVTRDGIIHSVTRATPKGVDYLKKVMSSKAGEVQA